MKKLLTFLLAVYVGMFAVNTINADTTDSTEQVADYVEVKLTFNAKYNAENGVTDAEARIAAANETMGQKFATLAAAATAYRALFKYSETDYYDGYVFGSIYHGGPLYVHINDKTTYPVGHSIRFPVATVEYIIHGEVAAGADTIQLGHSDDGSLSVTPEIKLTGADETAKISGTIGITAKVAGGYAEVYVEKGSFTVDGIEFTATTGSATIEADGTNYGTVDKNANTTLTVQNCTFHNRLYSYVNDTTSDPLVKNIKNNKFVGDNYDGYFYMIQGQCTTLNFEGNVASGYVRGVNIQFENDDGVANIKNNDLTTSSATRGTIQLTKAAEVTISGNEINNPSGAAIRFYNNNEGTVYAATKTTISGNTFNVAKVFQDNGDNEDLVTFDGTNMTLDYDAESNTVAEGTVTEYNGTDWAAPAETTNWIQVANVEWYGDGSATEYTIDSAEELAGLAKLVNDGNTFADKTIHLGADINLAGKEWTPIGLKEAGKPFCGTFNGAKDDGTNYQISGLTITANPGDVTDDGVNNVEDYAALFGCINTGATIKNVTVGGTVSGVASAAGLVARMNGGTIENCVNNVNVTGTGKAGGFVCLINPDAGAIIENCTNKGQILGGIGGTGGIVGLANMGNTITGCVNNGNIGGGTEKWVGGIVGYAQQNGTTATKITGCDNTGAVNGLTAGSIVGFGGSVNVIGCDNTGMVSGTKVGAIAGDVQSGQATAILVNNTTTTTDIPTYGSSEATALVVGTGVTFDDGGKVTSGTFEIEPPASAVADGYSVIANTDGSYGLQQEYLVDGDNVFLNGASEIVIESQDGTDTDTNLKITYTKNGVTKTMLYNGTYARVHGGYKHPGTLGVDTSDDFYTITVKSGKIRDVLIGSKGRTNPNLNTLTMVGGTINVEGGDIETVAAAWYYCQSMTGTFTVNMKGGKVGSIYGGGETNYKASEEVQQHIESSMGDDAFTFVPTYNTVDINISGGSVGEVYGGGRVLTQVSTYDTSVYSMVTKTVTIDIVGGTVGYVNGGGFSGPNDNWGELAGQDQCIVEDAAITISGGTVSNVFGGGFNGQWKWTHQMNASGEIVIGNYNGTTFKEQAPNRVNKVVVNVKEGADITNLYMGGRSYAHVESTTVNMTGGAVDNFSTSGNYGYVTSSDANISGGTVGKLELVTRNYVGDIDLDVTGGTVADFYAGTGGAYKNSNLNEKDYNISTTDILGNVDVNFAEGVEPENAYLTTGLERAKSVTVNIPLTLTVMNLAADSSYTGTETTTGNFTIENETAVWNATVDATAEGVTFAENGNEEQTLTVIRPTASEPTNWIEVANVEWYGDGSATEYTIDSAEEFAGLAKLVNDGTSFANKTIKLGANINLDGKEWTPIGGDKTFNGSFDGQGHVISNVEISATAGNAGLFGKVGDQHAVYQNLTIENITITAAGNNVGAFVGNMVNTKAVENIDVKGAINISTTGEYVGGVIGYGYASTISLCDVNGTTTDGTESTIHGTSQVGGIIGYVGESYGTREVKNNTVTAVKITAEERVGSIAGTVSAGGKVMNNAASSVTLISDTNNGDNGLIVGRTVGTEATGDNNDISGVTYVINNTTAEVSCKAAGEAVTVISGIRNETNNGPYAVNGTGVTFDETTGKITGGTFERLGTFAVANDVAEGYAVSENENGTFTVAEPKVYVAEVNGTKYETIDAALTKWATDGGTLKLLSDVETATLITIDGKTAVLDLNGKILSHTATKYNSAVFTTKNGTQLTIQDSSTEGQGKVTITGYFVVITSSTEDLITLTSGTLETTKSSSARVISAGVGKFVMTGGHITATGKPYTSGMVYVSNGDISGGQITAASTEGVLVSVAGKGSLIVSGDDTVIEGGRTAISTGSIDATITINGGRIGGNVNGVHTTSKRVSVSIAGGVVSAGTGGYAIYVGSNGSILISGGKVSGLIPLTELTATVTGGDVSEVSVCYWNANGVLKVNDSVVLPVENITLHEKDLVGYKLNSVKEGDATVYTAVIDPATAQAIIDGVYYPKFADALKAVKEIENAVITLNTDIQGNFSTQATSNFTLDLNGHTITGNDTSSRLATIIVLQNSTMIVTNSKDTGGITAPGNAEAIWIRPGAKLTIGAGVTVTGDGNDYDSGTIFIGKSSSSTTLDKWGPATLNLYGTINGNGDCAIKGHGENQTEPGTLINIYEGAKITSDYTAIYHPEYGTVNVYGGEIIGKSGIEMRAGTLNVVGGSIIGTGTFATNANGGGCTVNGVGVVISQHTTDLALSLNVTGGEISGTKYAVYEEDLMNETATDLITMNVTGGTFKVDPTVEGAAAVLSENVTGFVAGGAYSTMLDEGYCAANYVQSEKDAETGLYEVVWDSSVTAVAEVGGVKYTTLQEAIDAVPANGAEASTITVLSNMTLEETVWTMLDEDEDGNLITQNIILDLNGKTITYTGDAWALENYGTMTIKGNGSVLAPYGAALYNGGDLLVVENGTFESGYEGSSALENSYGKAEIKGGTFTGSGVGILNNYECELVITGGTIEGKADAGVYNCDGAVSISGETTKVIGVDAALLNDAEMSDGTFAVSGGTFSHAIAPGFCASGFVPMETTDENNNTVYGVEEGSYVAEVGGENYETLKAAIDAAVASESDKIVTILNGENINWGDNFTLVDGITIQLGEWVKATPPEGYYWDENGILVAVTNWIQVADTAWWDDADLDQTSFTISTPEELAGLSLLVMNGEFYGLENPLTFTLGADIDLAKYEWTPIGMGDYSFTGTFDGNNKTISNLKVNLPSTAYVGLFAAAEDVTLKNIVVENATVTGSGGVGGIVGFMGGTISVTNCHLKGKNVITAANGHFAGGMISMLYQTTGDVSDCSAEGTLTVTATGGDTAGLVGRIWDPKSIKLTDCSVTGDITVTSKGNYLAAGLFATSQNINVTEVSNCHLSGKLRISAKEAQAAGIISGAYATLIENCSVKGEDLDENGTKSYIRSEANTFTAGIIAWAGGSNNSFVVKKCSVENVDFKANAWVGGIVGYANRGLTVEECAVSKINVTGTHSTMPACALVVGSHGGTSTAPTRLYNNTMTDSVVNFPNLENSEVTSDQALALYTWGESEAKNNAFVGTSVKKSEDGKVTAGTFTIFDEAIAETTILADGVTWVKQADTWVITCKVSIDGVSISAGSGEGWTFADGVLTIANDAELDITINGDYTLAGCIVVPEDGTATINITEESTGVLRGNIPENVTVTGSVLKMNGMELAAMTDGKMQIEVASTIRLASLVEKGTVKIRYRTSVNGDEELLEAKSTSTVESNGSVLSTFEVPDFDKVLYFKVEIHKTQQIK